MLIKQNKTVGQIAVLIVKKKCVLYLITQSRYYEKPANEDILQMLQNLKILFINNDIQTLALPKICEGYTKKWPVILLFYV